MVIPPVPEQLVEGHTVFATLETVGINTEESEYASAVAVLVRERVRTTTLVRFPGVLWFNDQFLVDPTHSAGRSTPERYPCTGAVIAVNRGDLIVDTDLGGNYTLVGASYANESYFITDPNEHQWIVDLWNTTYGRPAWTVAIMNNQAGYGTPDDGKCRSTPWLDSPCTPSQIEPPSEIPADVNDIAVGQRCTPTSVSFVTVPDPRHKSPGDNGMGYPCPGCAMLKYNALLYFRLQHLDVAGAPKNHTETTGDDWTFDPAACHPTSSGSWQCPGGDDDREGNSHPYNPDFATGVPYAGRDNHGGSADCDGVWEDCHATRNIDVYYGYMDPPLVRNFVILDVQGADAPYHCHDTMTFCGPGDIEDDVNRLDDGPPSTSTLPP